MSKFRVRLHQFVEEVNDIEVEAETAEAAAELANAMHSHGDIVHGWKPGDDVIAGAAARIDGGAYVVLDGDGNEVWERL